MRTPDLALWVYAKPFATLGSLTFDLQKFLKEVGQVKEAIKSGAFSQSSGLNEQNLLFMDDFSPDNELELTFNMDTMRAELESKATKQGFQLLGERISKSARLLLLKKID
jgi:secreted Zn-dependent insulinase-like peptidase